MNTRKKLLTASSICSAVLCALYFIATAVLFCVDNSWYKATLLLVVLALIHAVLSYTLIKRMLAVGMDKSVRVRLIVFAVVGVVSLPSAVLCLIALLIKGDEHPIETQSSVSPAEHTRESSRTSQPFFKRKNTIIAGVALIAVFVFSFSAMVVENNGFKTDVSTFTLDYEMTKEYNSTPVNNKTYVIVNDCLSYEVNMYVPSIASELNPCPTVFVLPGFTRTKETMTQYCVELARRGAVVFTIDPGCQGGSTWAGYKYDENGDYLVDENGELVPYSSSVSSNGLNYLIQYVYNNVEDFPFVDRSRIGAVGHSQGALNVVMTTQNFSGKSFEQSVVKAMAITGYVNGIGGRFQNIHANCLMSYGYYEEGYYGSSFEATAKRFLNDVNGVNINTYVTIDLDTPYGDISDGSYRIIHRERINHCFQMYHKQSVANVIDFFDTTLQIGSTIDSTNQVWWLKEVFNGLALAGAFVFIVCIMTMLVDTKLFADVKGTTIQSAKPVELYPGRFNKKSTDKLLFWITTVLTAIIACLDYYPLAELSIKWFPDANAGVYTYFFPAKMVNAIMLWATVNGLIGLVVFFGTVLLKNLYEKIRANVKGETPTYDFSQFEPLKIKFIPLLKTVLIAVIAFGSFSLLTQLCMWIFHQDFRFFMVGAGVLQWRNVVAWLMYIPFFAIFYLSNSIRVNCGIGFEGWKEWKVYLVAALANTVGLIFIVFIHYAKYAMTGQVYYHSWLYINMVFGIIPMMAILPIWNRAVYKKTNNVYLGALSSCMIFIMMTISASVNYIPL